MPASNDDAAAAGRSRPRGLGPPIQVPGQPTPAEDAYNKVLWPLAGYLQLVIQHLGHPYGSSWHTSSGGLDVRISLLPGPVTFNPDTLDDTLDGALDEH